MKSQNEQIRDLERINLELFRACKFAHALLDSKSRDADRIEERLRHALQLWSTWNCTTIPSASRDH